MSRIKKWGFYILLVGAASLLWMPPNADSQHGQKPGHGSAVSGAKETPPYPSMAGPGKKIFIGNDYYFIYGFDKKPQMGIVILKVVLYTKEGKKDTTLQAKADAGMPSMKGAHETGDRSFKISKNGDYLLPIDIVMPGDWEIRLTFIKDGKVVFRGSYQFDV